MKRPSTRKPSEALPGHQEDPTLDVAPDVVRARAQARWPRLSLEDLAAFEAEFETFSTGNHQLLVGRLRERYGLAEQDAEDEVRRFVLTLDPSQRGSDTQEHSTATRGPHKPASP